MVNSKNLIFLRYIALISALLTTLYYINISNIIPTIGIFLVIIINNQIRIFFLNNKLTIFISILIELCFISLMIFYLGGNITFYLIPVLLDSTLLFNSKTTIFLNIIIAILAILVSLKFDLLYLLKSFITLLLFYIIILHIKMETKTKLNAQDLYDKLRISEEKLLKANSELELYANTIEEITILKERNRISREIHDSVGHALSATIIQLNGIEEVSKKSSPEITSTVATLREFITTSLKDVRMAVRELKPSNFSQFENIVNLQEMINKFAKLTGINCKLITSQKPWLLNNNQYLVCYRIIQESLSNALKHGKATKIDIFLTFSEIEAILTIKDNGIGCIKINKGFGLTGINERIKEIDGSLTLQSTENKGFIVKVNFPRKGSDFLDE